MKITKIQQQVKRPERYSIYINGKYSFSLDEQTLAEKKLEVGRTVGETDIGLYQHDSILGKALDAAYRYLSYRPRSINEVRIKLGAKYDKKTVDDAVKRLVEQRYLDDQNFAQNFAKELQEIGHRSAHRIKYELIKKGIDQEIIIQVSGDISDEAQIESIKDLIARKQSRYQDERKLMAYLASQGFSYGQIKKALEGP